MTIRFDSLPMPCDGHMHLADPSTRTVTICQHGDTTPRLGAWFITDDRAAVTCPACLEWIHA